MDTLKSIPLTTEAGKRNVRNANAVRRQLMEKAVEALQEAGFAASISGSGEIVFPVCRDEITNSVFYLRLAATLSDKPPIVAPSIFETP